MISARFRELLWFVVPIFGAGALLGLCVGLSACRPPDAVTVTTQMPNLARTAEVVGASASATWFLTPTQVQLVPAPGAAP